MFLWKIVTIKTIEEKIVGLTLFGYMAKDDFQSLSRGGGEGERESVFYNFELLKCYVCTIQFLVVLYHEIKWQL